MARPTKSADGAKGETLTIRLRPRVKYVLDLLSRKQHRSMSDVIETLVAKAADETFTSRALDGDVQSISKLLWAKSEAERLLRLARHQPDLMTYDDELRYAVICSSPSLWLETKRVDKGIYVAEPALSYGGSTRLNMEVLENLNMEVLENAWPYIKLAANDEISEVALELAVDEIRRRAALPPANKD